MSLFQLGSGARPASFACFTRQTMILPSEKLSLSRTFFSLPSFPPSTPSENEVHGVEDLSVKDRYSKKGDLLVYKETKRLPYATKFLLHSEWIWRIGLSR